MRYVTKSIWFFLMVVYANAFGAGQTPDISTSHSDAEGQLSPNADNSSMNVRDGAAGTQTPQKQSNSVVDRKLLAAVRRTVVKDKTLSTTAHNVKIMVAGGVVTLRGPVKSDEEKAKIESLAKQIEGVSSVNNELDVKTNKHM